MTAIYVSIAALTVTLLAQFGAIVWFAASIRAAVTQLVEAVKELRAVVQVIPVLERRVSILEDRQDRPARKPARPFRPPTTGV